MNPHLHVLKGCAPVPLANYLKALGILRLVGEQVDPQARAWWEGERFCLLTKLSKEELEAFFLEHYAPTPLLSPWNAGSGFYRTWDAKAKRLRNSKNAAALDSLLASNNPRIESLRNAVQEVHEVLPRFCQRIDVSKLDKKGRDKLMILPDGAGPTFPVVPKDDTGKLQVQRILLRQSRRSDFYHAALVEVEGAVKCPWLFGSGGNDGNIDYTGRFFENLKAVLFQDGGQNNRMLLQNALYDEHVVGFLTGSEGKIGQFLPSAAGGANTTTLTPGIFYFRLREEYSSLLVPPGALIPARPAALVRRSPFGLMPPDSRRPVQKRHSAVNSGCPSGISPRHCTMSLQCLVKRGSNSTERRPTAQWMSRALSVASVSPAESYRSFDMGIWKETVNLPLPCRSVA